MTTNEILMLAVGLALGAQSMNALHAYWASKDARRAAAQSDAVLKRMAGDSFLSSFRLYRLQEHPRLEPHPAELLEASVRDLELKLWDAADRVEDAARRDGLL
ncbi:hypothetical protein CJI59_13960 [Streptomyces sp. Alain-F2R5]|nr:hypothetical protein [Streptomyces sp. Alain-F2R5]PAN01023.1 hypothetical protein CJI59_13960 [Streptomyces sp. Alain-F2R5]